MPSGLLRLWWVIDSRACCEGYLFGALLFAVKPGKNYRLEYIITSIIFYALFVQMAMELGESILVGVKIRLNFTRFCGGFL